MNYTPSQWPCNQIVYIIDHVDLASTLSKVASSREVETRTWDQSTQYNSIILSVSDQGAQHPFLMLVSPEWTNTDKYSVRTFTNFVCHLSWQARYILLAFKGEIHVYIYFGLKWNLHLEQRWNTPVKSTSMDEIIYFRITIMSFFI